ncbi:hypothetical protein T10_5039 [Trichinella papuae]|uniref:Uncharacterized protein n=1 Tax=Trichinella papuae TaxID=268474 RepID=A0A0V1MNE9_9BILA|nr:hypothetical protein T10_5039 [Trichinella papuae]
MPSTAIVRCLDKLMISGNVEHFGEIFDFNNHLPAVQISNVKSTFNNKNLLNRELLLIHELLQ